MRVAVKRASRKQVLAKVPDPETMTVREAKRYLLNAQLVFADPVQLKCMALIELHATVKAGIEGQQEQSGEDYGHAPKPLERDINKGIRDILELDGWRIVMMETVSDHERRRYFGEPGMPDMLCLRYGIGKFKTVLPSDSSLTDVLWIEGKRRTGTVAKNQADWHRDERRRGAITLIAKEDFDATIEGFFAWYEASGLMRKAMEL